MGPVGSGTQFIINSSLSSTLFPSPHPSCFCNCSIHRDNSSSCRFLCSNSSCNTHFLFFVFLTMARCFQPHLQHLAYYSLFFTIFQFLLSCSFTVPLSLPQLLQFLNTQSSKSLGEGLIPCLPKQPVIESATLTAPVLSREKSQRSLRWIWAGSWFMEL